MAKKSKTQRAKASAARQQRKADREYAALHPEEQAPQEEPVEKKKIKLFNKDEEEESSSNSKAVSKVEEKRPNRVVQFFRDVKSEMKRVTWPTRTDVLQWSGVVVVALLFFGIYVALLDNAIITPLLVLVSGIGA